MWFRPELVRQVDWGGDPHNAKLAAAEGDDVRLSPRKSFDLWRETVRGRAEPWHESEVRAATRFGRHLTAALLRRQRHHAEIAIDLQRAMRPATLPTIDGWTLDVHDEPAGTGQIGGDWFDVFEVGGGLLAAVVGDVAGHGLRASAEMAQLRNSLRAYLLDDPTPSRRPRTPRPADGRVLPGTLATAVCAVIDTASAAVRLSHAGHVPTIVGATTAAFVADAEGDVLLGVRPGGRREQHVVLAPGDALVMYSDGLIERRDRPIDDGLELLRQHGRGGARPAGRHERGGLDRGAAARRAPRRRHQRAGHPARRLTAAAVRRRRGRAGRRGRRTRAPTGAWPRARPGTPRRSSSASRPACRAHAPLVAGAQAGEAVLRHRRRQVVAVGDGELQELVGDHAADDVEPGVVAAVLAAARAVVPGQRVHRARDQLVAEDVALLHVVILADRRRPP